MAVKTEYVLEFGSDRIEVTVTNKSGTIHSNLKSDREVDREKDSFVDGMESLLLALACAGINLRSRKVQEAVQTVLDKMSQMW